MDTQSNNHPRASDPSTSTSTSAQGIELEHAPAPTNTSTDQAEASIPTEPVINGTNLNRTVTVRRKAAKRTDPLYLAPPPRNIAAPLSLSPPPQAEDIPVTQESRVEVPLPTITDEAARKTASPDISEGLPTPDTPLSAATVDISTRGPSRRLTQLPPTETSKAQLDDDDDDDDADLSGPVPPPSTAIVNALTRRRSSRHVIPISCIGTPIPPLAATTHCRSSRRVIPSTSTTATVDVSTSSRRSRRQTQLSPIEEQLDDDDGGDLPRLSWEDRFSVLAEYRRIHGHCNVPRRYSESIQLGYWVSTQRSKYRLHAEGKTSPMTPFRIRKVESLGFEWDSFGTAWKDRFSELADYHIIHGHCNVPQRYNENSKLGRWVGTQRSKYRLQLEGKISAMTLFHIKELESLGFEWRVCVTAPWEDRLNELANYRKIHGHCNVPEYYSENIKLGFWVSKQWQHYKLHRQGKKSLVTTLRIQA
jgi:hypothetical protein